MCHACPKKEPRFRYKKPSPPRREKLDTGYECFQPRKNKGYIRDPIIKKTVYVCDTKPSLTAVEKKFHVKPYIKCYEIPEGMMAQMDTEGTNIEIPPNVLDQLKRQNMGGNGGFQNNKFDPYGRSQQPPIDYTNNCIPQCHPEVVCDNKKKTKVQERIDAIKKTKIRMVEWDEYKEPPAPTPHGKTKIVEETKKEEPVEKECYNPIPIHCTHNNPLLVKCLEKRTLPNGPSNGPLPRFMPKYMCDNPPAFGKVLSHGYQKEWLVERDDLREQYYPSNPCPPLNIKFVPCPSIARDEKDKVVKRRTGPRPWYINFLIGNREKDGKYFWLLKPCMSDCKDGILQTCSRRHNTICSRY